MIFMVWNYRGLGRATTVKSLWELLRTHRPDVLFLSETKLHNHDIALQLGLSLGFSFVHCVPAIGKAGGLLLLWKDPASLQVIIDNSNMVNCLMVPADPSGIPPWQLTFVYGPPSG